MNEYSFYDDRKKIKIRFPVFLPGGFDLEVTVDKNIPLEELIDLDGLNKFVLEGE